MQQQEAHDAIVAGLHADKTNLDAEVVTLAKALDQGQQQLELQHTHLDQQQTALQLKDAALETLRQQVSDLLQQQQQDRATLHTQQQQLTQHQHDHQRVLEQESAATMTIHDVTARLDRTLRQLEQSETERHVHQEARAALQREVELLRNRAELSPSEVEGLRNTVQQHEVEIDALTAVQRTLEERCQALHTHNTELQVARDESRDAQDKVQVELKAVQAQLKATQDELSNSRQQQRQLGMELKTAVATAQAAQDQDAQQLQFALAQCYRDVLDTIQTLAHVDGAHLPPTSNSAAASPRQQLQQLRASVDHVKQRVLLRHRDTQGQAQELSEQSHGLQVC